MRLRSTSLRLVAAVAICTGLLVAVAHSGEVRDHRSGSSGGGVQTSATSTVRDHRSSSTGTPVVRDHRSKPVSAITANRSFASAAL
jgi:hypothetical protein